MKKSRPWNLNKESILKPSFNTFISPHKIIDISVRLNKKPHLIININRIFLKTVSILSVIVSFSLYGIDMWLYILFSRAPVGVN